MKISYNIDGLRITSHPAVSVKLFIGPADFSSGLYD
jgi:hypothetical protein